MNLGDPRPEFPDPLLGIAVFHDVADVEIRLDPRALEAVDVVGEFDRAEEELVPNFLDREDDAFLLGVGNQALDRGLRASHHVAIRDFGGDDAGYDENGRAAVGLAVQDLLADRLLAALDDLGVGVGKTILPMDRAADAVDDDPRFVARFQNLVAVEFVGAEEFNPFKPSVLEPLEVRQDRA